MFCLFFQLFNHVINFLLTKVTWDNIYTYLNLPYTFVIRQIEYFHTQI